MSREVRLCIMLDMTPFGYAGRYTMEYIIYTRYTQVKCNIII